MNDNEILKALETIKKVCSEQKSDCVDCPFYSTDCGCNINDDIPKNWKIVGNGKWKAFNG